MRWFIALWFLGVALGSSALAADGHVSKVLPQFLDEKGRASLSPSLYDRDAYQAVLRKNPAKRSGLRFAVEWKAAAKSEHLKLRVELRGTVEGDAPKTTTLESPVHQSFWSGHWTDLTFTGAEYKAFGEVTAWRVTLWDGDRLLDEQKSFLWEK
jgi:hypothetical protein